jgi:hypothetical protein
MNDPITLLHWGNPGPSELNAIKIAKCMGRMMRPLQLTSETTEHEQYLRGSLPPGGCMIASAETIVEICNRSRLGLEFLQVLKTLAADIFVYGFHPVPEHGRIVQELTAGSLLGVEALRAEDSRFVVDANSREVCKQFAGLSFEARTSRVDFTFIEGREQNSCSSLIRIAERPFFVCANHGGARVLLSACREIADLGMVVPRKTPRLRFFSALVPLMMFIGCASGNGSWHNDSPSACFIVDDPLLRRQYGFLDYQKLSELMDRECFSTSIAFIPWNYRRSDPRVAELLASRPLTYSLCVHGCDHARGEFGSTDQHFLREKAQQAFERMTMHRALSGLDFDDVMVFPQGIFSTAAMSALQSCGYLAAVNSTPYPIDAEVSLTLEDLLQVAVTRISNLPLFTRRYPCQLPELAFDLFLGKPALLVEHHGFFREGYEGLAQAVDRLNRLDGRLRWTNLGTICSHACLTRLADNGEVHVLFFTNRFRFRNESDRPKHFTLTRRTSEQERVKGFLINGLPVDIARHNGWIRARILLDAGELAEVEVHRDQPGMTKTPPPNRLHHARVFVRRRLSEFRDNYLDRSRFLSRIARNLLTNKAQTH